MITLTRLGQISFDSTWVLLDCWIYGCDHRTRSLAFTDHPWPARWMPDGKVLSILVYMEVSWTRGTPKSSILMGCSIINQPFLGYLHFWNPHIDQRFDGLLFDPLEPDTFEVDGAPFRRGRLFGGFWFCDAAFEATFGRRQEYVVRCVRVDWRIIKHQRGRIRGGSPREGWWVTQFSSKLDTAY